MTAPLVVVVTYNSARDIDACLSSVFNQIPCPDVVVVDNASTDSTADLLSQWASSRGAFVHINGTNAGFASACNTGIRKHRRPGQPVLLLNPDTMLPEGAITRMLALLGEPGAGVATLRLENASGEVDAACARKAPNLSTSVKHALRLTSGHSTTGYTASPAQGDEVVELEATVGALMLVASDVMDEVGLLDEDFWMYGEDLDYCKRVRDSGRRILQAGSPVVIHHKGGSSGARRKANVNHAFHRAMWLYYKKHLATSDPLPMRAVVGAGIVAREGVTTVLALVSTTRTRIGR